jgi:ATP-dependent DNA helicase RecQ
VAINSTKGERATSAAWDALADGSARYVFLSPEQLANKEVRDRLATLRVGLFAVDEAHCVSSWGHDFRPDYLVLGDVIAELGHPPTLAATATGAPPVRAEIVERLGLAEPRLFSHGFDRPNLHLAVHRHESDTEKRAAVIGQVRDLPHPGLVYTATRRDAEDYAHAFNVDGMRAAAYHAGLPKAEREEVYRRFIDEEAEVVTATSAFGMGIDKADVRYVFHTDLPGSLEAYYQEIGRAGRDGEPAEAHMLFGLEDIRMRRVFIDQEDAGEDRKRREHARLNMLLGYCEASRCRRQLLLEYFGEQADACGNCDICRDPAERIDATEDAKKILAAIRGTGERYGAGHIIDVLLGNRTERMTEAHAALEVFGKGALRKKDEWQSLIRQMAGDGLLRHDLQGYGGLEIAEKGHALLRGHGAFEARPIKPRVRTKKESRNAQIAEQSEANQTLIAALKALRMRLAKEKRVPPYVIFSDKSLIDMAQLRPRDDSEFGMVHGVGAAKQKEFGKVFLAAIREHRA